MTQLTYNLYQAAAHAGLLYDIEPHRIVTRAAEGVIIFGRALVAGTDAEKQVILPDPAGLEKFRGIAEATWAGEQSIAGQGEYKDKAAVNVIKQGIVWVLVTQNVLVDDPAYYVITAGADLGKFRKDATEAELVPTGVFRSSANSGTLAQLEINLP